MRKFLILSLSIDRIMNFAPPPGFVMRDLNRPYILGMDEEDFTVGGLLSVKWTDNRTDTWSDIAQNNIWLPLYIAVHEKRTHECE